jgi:class 3 adenylate cyclase
MAVYLGDNKNSAAAHSALNINWAVKNIVNPAIKAQYPHTAVEVRQTVGIDTSPLFVARTGIRGANDLVWVGRAANYAAKLSGLREGYASLITEDVFKKLNEGSKFGGEPRRVMWSKLMWAEMVVAIYGSKWTWGV